MGLNLNANGPLEEPRPKISKKSVHTRIFW